MLYEITDCPESVCYAENSNAFCVYGIDKTKMYAGREASVGRSEESVYM